MGRLGKTFSAVEIGSGTVAPVVVGFFMVFTVANVVGRYFFNYPIPGHTEIVEISLALAVFAGISYAQRVGAHVRIGLVLDKLPKRLRPIFEILFLLGALAYIGVIAVYAVKFTIFKYQIGAATDVLSIPRWPFIACVSIGAGLLVIRFAIQIIHRLALLIGLKY